LHERDIRRDLGPFSFLKTRALKQAFLDELTVIVEKVPFHLVSVVIRKDALQKRYNQPENPYHLALQYGLERISAFLQSQGEWQAGSNANPKVHLVVEQRGRNEDDELELEFRRICDRGNYNQESFAFEVVFADKQSNSSGLQLADLMARPMGMSVLKPEQANRAVDVIKRKLVQVKGRAAGWGSKVFP
jgi:hypothetical protein